MKAWEGRLRVRWRRHAPTTVLCHNKRLLAAQHFPACRYVLLVVVARCSPGCFKSPTLKVKIDWHANQARSLVFETTPHNNIIINIIIVKTKSRSIGMQFRLDTLYPAPPQKKNKFIHYCEDNNTNNDTKNWNCAGNNKHLKVGIALRSPSICAPRVKPKCSASGHTSPHTCARQLGQLSSSWNLNLELASDSGKCFSLGSARSEKDPRSMSELRPHVKPTDDSSNKQHKARHLGKRHPLRKGMQNRPQANLEYLEKRSVRPEIFLLSYAHPRPWNIYIQNQKRGPRGSCLAPDRLRIGNQTPLHHNGACAEDGDNITLHEHTHARKKQKRASLSGTCPNHQALFRKPIPISNNTKRVHQVHQTKPKHSTNNFPTPLIEG